ncbi:hypothetical protein CU098_006939, partial [Rhizopus stolonifer]
MITVVQSFVRNSTNTIIIPKQLVSFICVFIIAKTPTYLLVGFIVGYMMLIKKEKLVYTNHKNEDTMEFESLLQFPSCPTTLPQLDNSFYFKRDDQIQSRPIIQKDQITQQDKERDKELQKTCHSLYVPPISVSLEANPAATTLVENNDQPPAVLVVTNIIETSPVVQKQDLFGIDIEELLLMPPPPPIPSKHSLSSPGQLFKSKFQKAVSRMKKQHYSGGTRKTIQDKRFSSLSDNTTT